MNKDSEQRTGNLNRVGGATGAPVTELKYKHYNRNAVLEEADAVTYQRI
ncbi:hypothetical protein PCURB6_32440 [Paenibacillus curdlanolyticus]|nr:hypothetical protein PCURB6_32440 [Paenibacillus curdlanolyticus]